MTAFTWWLSFCDPEAPKGQQFMGVAIVPADSFLEALLETKRLHCNPAGSEANGMKWAPVEFVDPARMGVLLTKEQAEALDAETFAKAKAAGLVVKELA